MDATHDPSPSPTRLGEPELDLYTIPISASWFKWEDIHEKEREAMREFFDGSSIMRTPKIYKDYRDFIINKFREEPSRRLTFTETRKSLIGDASLILRVFRFLEDSGIINFFGKEEEVARGEIGDYVRVEDGLPNGIRVVGLPEFKEGNSVAGVKRLPAPLASYSDVFGELGGRIRDVGGVRGCGSCGGSCDSGRYECTKGNHVICVRCFENGSYGENMSKDDFRFHEVVGNGATRVAAWSDEETLLLLESVLRHGDDWELVARDVPTKSKVDCISKLIELPFADLLLSSGSDKDNSGRLSGSTDNVKEAPLPPFESVETKIDEEEFHDQKPDKEENGDTVDEGPPLKRKRVASLSDAGSSLMQQAALISTMVGSDIASAAADAAVTALCKETSCPREIFDNDEDSFAEGLFPSNWDSDLERVPIEDSEATMKHVQTGSQETPPIQNGIPLSLRLRAAVATALGAASAHAKLLADQEDRQIESLMAIIIETQLKKLNRKIKHFDDLELIMEKEYAELEALKESLTEEWTGILQRRISAGSSKCRDHGHNYLKTPN